MRTVTVFGSMNMDLVIRAGHMPAAGETVRGGGFMTNPGGKGANQSAACGRMGASVRMAACVGEDAFGAELKGGLESFGVDTRYVRAAEGVSSGIAVIVLADSDNRIILDAGANAHLSAGDAERALEDARAGDILMAQLETPTEAVLAAFKLARQKDMTVILNPAPASRECLALLPYADLVVPNETELALLSGVSGIDEGAAELMRLGARQVIVTLGSKGSLLIDGENRLHVPAFEAAAVDTTAAGDTYLGTLAACFAEDKDIAYAMRAASAASAIAVTRKGAQSSIPSRAETEALLASHGN